MKCIQGKPLHLISIVLVSNIWLAGCASSVPSLSENAAPSFRDERMSAQAASDGIVIGKSTKAEVQTALGPANVVKFDSGFEVWVYGAREAKASSARAEFVILFTPSGIVKKTRIKPPYVSAAN